jgi:hypothetical protein
MEHKHSRYRNPPNCLRECQRLWPKFIMKVPRYMDFAIARYLTVEKNVRPLRVKVIEDVMHGIIS